MKIIDLKSAETIYSSNGNCIFAEGVNKLENFVVQALAKEITEFAKDKRDVVETKVRLVREARSQLEGLKSRFIKESAQKMSSAVSRHLKAELNQLQEDIQVARENNFSGITII